MVPNNLRFLKIATISLFAVILIVGCTNQAYSVNNSDSRDGIGKQLNENLPDNINEPLDEASHEEEYQYDMHDESNKKKEPGDIHDLDFDAVGQEVREFDNNFDGISLQGSPVPPIINVPELCIYSSLRNVNCRASDYVESSLIAILMQGEEANLLSLNPTFTHGRFEIATLQQCWIALRLMQGPSDPYKMCQVSVVDAPPPIGVLALDGSDLPVCSRDLDKDPCLAAGGEWKSGAVGAPYCEC